VSNIWHTGKELDDLVSQIPKERHQFRDDARCRQHLDAILAGRHVPELPSSRIQRDLRLHITKSASLAVNWVQSSGVASTAEIDATKDAICPTPSVHLIR
jgi:hypothetical protein